MTDTDTIARAYRELAAWCNGIADAGPHSIGGPGFEPEMSDAKAINKELFALAKRVDAVIEAVGNYCRHYGIVNMHDVTSDFTDVLHDAIDGNCTFCIEDGTKARVRDREDAEAERADHMRAILAAETG